MLHFCFVQKKQRSLSMFDLRSIWCKLHAVLLNFETQLSCYGARQSVLKSKIKSCWGSKVNLENVSLFFGGLPALRLRLVDTQQAVITQLASGVNGFNSHQLPESGPSSGELESLEGSSCFTPPPIHLHPLNTDRNWNSPRLEKVLNNLNVSYMR